MGQRANLLLVRGGDYELYYTHWGAGTLPADLFWGPEWAERFVRAQQRVDETGWLDDVWAEGGALLDLDRHRVLVYGGEDLANEAPLRRRYLELMRRVWRDWEVHWAHEGIAALADYVGHPRREVLTADPRDAVCSLEAPPEPRFVQCLGSVRWAQRGIRLYPLHEHPLEYVACGPELLASGGARNGRDAFGEGHWPEEFPIGGFHADVLRRTLELWITADAAGVVEHLGDRWPGWEVAWHHDAWEWQEDRCDGRLRYPRPDPAALEQRLVDLLLGPPRTSGAEMVQRLAATHRAEGKQVEISPWALRDDVREVPLEARRRILAAALGREP